MKIKVLMFNTMNALNYWMKYIIKFLDKHKIDFKFNFNEKIILIGDIKLEFYPEYRHEKLVGWRYSSILYDSEFVLEKDFIKTICELLEVD